MDLLVRRCTHEDAGGAEGERLEDVGAAADAAVEEDGELPASRLHNLHTAENQRDRSLYCTDRICRNHRCEVEDDRVPPRGR
ncbi:Os07g0152950 [Oryza sativa Japonica Group]|uniref:Os07g0152950 protein n=1 Tax=Oryza sativa subsp. japonica TaxID=39947 RepID=A0A0P0X2R1_ORYSJ|nr:hypothetical protein EE612_037196 [Oryza sativa]BAT00102.1 Os07g0152950 [Oryza sativa Japonica Group]